MIKLYFASKFRKAESAERAEALPAAIITAIISSLLLLGIASVISFLVQSKTEAEGHAQLTTIASNIDVSIRSDVANASYITGSATLKQPATRLISPSDLILNGVNMHIPVGGTNECKIIRWSVSGDTIARELKLYASTNNDSVVKCDESSAVKAERNKIFADHINVVDNRFVFYNQLGRELTFHQTETSLANINAALEKKLIANNTTKLNDVDFNALNSLLRPDSFEVAFADSSACPMNVPSAAGVCPSPETTTIAAAWNSTKIGKVSINLEIIGDEGDAIKRDVEQNSSIPLYLNGEEVAAAVAGSTTENRPKAPMLTISTNPVVLGTAYTLSWESLGSCPVGMKMTSNLYENGSLAYSGTDTSLTRTQIDANVPSVVAYVEAECERGALKVNSLPSNTVTANIVPPAPNFVLTQKPPVTNAPLDSVIASDTTCLYGARIVFDLSRTVYANEGGLGYSGIGSLNLRINQGFIVREGSKYDYRASATCKTPYASSATVSLSTGIFTTVINTPTMPRFISPQNGHTGVAPSTTISWSAATCAVGTTVQYHLTNDYETDRRITRVVLNWTANTTSAVVSNKQGYQLGWLLTARCVGSAATSAQTPYEMMRFSTRVNAPGPVEGIWNNGWSRVEWIAPNQGCAPEAPIRYRLVQTKVDDRPYYQPAAWQDGGGQELPVPHTGGYPQWATVETICDGLVADSTINQNGATTKWIKNFDVSFSAGMQYRRMNVWASCPYATEVSDLQVYVAAQGWGGTRYPEGIQTDEGVWIASAGPGPGGNSDWVALNSNQNHQWIHTTANWGFYGDSGWGARYTVNDRTPYMEGTYWNASAWGNFGYWWYGSCSTPYMSVSAKGSYWEGGGANNIGNPNTRWDAQGNGRSLTDAGLAANR